MSKTAYDRALNSVLALEGGYSNDPDDTGGETYRGIARRFHPYWQGWQIVDKVKMDVRAEYNTREWVKVLNVRLDNNEDLQAQVSSFYRSEFWSRFRGDFMPDPIAEELLDSAVNLGVHRSVSFLQRAMNLFASEPLNIDGVVGRITEERANALDESEVRATVTIMNVLQGMHYIERVEDRPINAKYLKGWLKRVTLEKQ